MTITVFTRPRCVSCNATKHLLDQLGLEYDVIDVSIDTAAGIMLVDAGFRAAPVVRVAYETGEADWWSGFRDDRIRALAE